MKIRTIGIVIMLLLLQKALAQSPISENIFTLHGRLHGTHKDSVLIYYENNEGHTVFQSRPIYSDRFIITDSLNRGVSAVIIFKDQGETISDSAFEVRSREIYLDPGQLYLTGDIGKMDSLKLEGSRSQDEWVELSKKIDPIKKEMQPLTDRYNREKDPETAAQISTKFEPYENRIKAIAYDFFLKHPDSYVAAHEMVSYVTQMGLDSSKRIYNAFSDKLKQSFDAQKVDAAIKKAESVQPGKTAPDFVVADGDGKAIALADYKDNYVLLDFWASWCPPCRRLNPHLIEIYNKYKGKRLYIISIAWNDDMQAGWKKAIAKDGIGLWPNVLNGTGTDNDLAEKYAVHFIPTAILIGPDGKIIGRYGDNTNTDVLPDKQLAVIFKE